MFMLVLVNSCVICIYMIQKVNINFSRSSKRFLYSMNNHELNILANIIIVNNVLPDRGLFFLNLQILHIK